jgi:hypothetical protein
MNYIKKLEKEQRVLKEMLIELKDYCLSSKFHWPNDCVNKNDILGRISNLSIWENITLNDFKKEAV